MKDLSQMTEAEYNAMRLQGALIAGNVQDIKKYSCSTVSSSTKCFGPVSRKQDVHAFFVKAEQSLESEKE